MPSTEIADAEVSRLIGGRETETIVVYDVSDAQLYGRKHRRKLTGALAGEAESADLVPVVFQAVYWWCLVYMPVYPLGTYYVIRCTKCDDPDGDADQYRAIRTDWDRSQLLFHYVIGVSSVAALVIGFWYMIPWLRG